TWGEDLRIEDLGIEDLGIEDLGIEDLGIEDPFATVPNMSELKWRTESLARNMRCDRGKRTASSGRDERHLFRFDVRRFVNQPPLLDVGALNGGECFRRLLRAWHNLLPDL